MMYFVCTINSLKTHYYDFLNEEVVEFPFECEIGKRWRIYYNDKKYVNSPIVKDIKITSVNNTEGHYNKVSEYDGIVDKITSIEVTCDECIIFLYCIGSWERVS